MNAVKSIEAQTIAAEIPGLLKEIAALPEKHYLTLGDESALYQEPRDVWIRPASDFRDAEKVAQNVGNWSYEVHYADFYDMSGRHIHLTERSELWRGIQEAITPTTWHHFAANAVHRYGHDFLMVGRGSYVVDAETTLDGERAFETISARELMRRERAELEQYMPAVIAKKPVWADAPTLSSIDDDSEPGTLGVFYFRSGFLPCDFNEHVRVEIAQYVHIDTTTGDVIEAEDVTPSIYIPEPRRAEDVPLTANELRAIGDAIRAMAELLAEIQAETSGSGS